MNLLLGAAVCLAMCVVPINSKNTKLTEVFSWKFMDYDWKNPEDRQAAIDSGEFVPENNLPLGLEVWKNKLFITIPRWKNGVVSTLNYIEIDEGHGHSKESQGYDKAFYESVQREVDIAIATSRARAKARAKAKAYYPYHLYGYNVPAVIHEVTSPVKSIHTVVFRKDQGENEESDDVVDVKKREIEVEVDTDDDDVEIDIETGESKKKKKHKGSKDEKKRRKKKGKKGKHDSDDNDDNDDNDERKDKTKKKKKKKCKPKPKPPTEAPPTDDETATTAAETETTADATPTTADETETTATTAETDPPVTAPPPRSPALIPYPSFEENRVDTSLLRMTNDVPIVSVFRVWADTCDRLWVMDTGVADVLGKRTIITKPRILIYDLNTDKLIKGYEFKDSDVEQHSFFANIVVDVDENNCDRAFAYVPDLGGYGVVVYDLYNDRSKRMKHNYFHFDPLAGNMNVGGVNFQWTDGVFSIALAKRKSDGFRTAYFHPLASTKEFSVSTKVLQSAHDSESNFYDYKVLGDRGMDSQSSASYIDPETGVMFYTQLQKDSVNCWNTNKPFKAENLDEVASDNDTMIFTNDLKVDREGNLWVLSDKLPTFIYKNLDDTEVNYRIFKTTVKRAVAGTKCAP